MHIGKIVFSQVIEHLPLHTFRRCVQQYDGNHKIKSFAQALIKIARPLYAEEDLGLDLDNTVYALGTSTIDLCLPVFSWALFCPTKSAVKLHTLLDLRGNIPTFIHISDGKLHDVNVLDILIPEPASSPSIN